MYILRAVKYHDYEKCTLTRKDNVKKFARCASGELEIITSVKVVRFEQHRCVKEIGHRKAKTLSIDTWNLGETERPPV